MDDTEVSQREAAELVAQLGRVIYGPGVGAKLTPAQWTALHYFSRANRFSRTVSAFAAYRSTTRGTASQTLKRMVERGYLHRSRAAKDGRSSRLDLSDRARSLLRDDPFQALVRAVGKLPPVMRDGLADSLQRVLWEVGRESTTGLFGTCSSCRFLESVAPCPSARSPWSCARFAEPLQEMELTQLCANREPTDAPESRAALPRS